jgi:hypothetical protein
MIGTAIILSAVEMYRSRNRSKSLFSLNSIPVKRLTHIGTRQHLPTPALSNNLRLPSTAIFSAPIELTTSTKSASSVLSATKQPRRVGENETH